MRLLIFILSFFPLSLLAYPIDTSLGFATGYTWSQAKLNDTVRTTSDGTEVPTYSDIKNQDMPWNLYLAFQVHENYGFEMGYLDYGSVGFVKSLITTSNTNEFVNSRVRNVDISTQGFYINHVLHVPIIKNIKLLAKAGILFGSNNYFETEDVVSMVDDGNGNKIENAYQEYNSSSDSFAKGQLSVGVIYQQQKNWSIRLQLNHINYDNPAEKEDFTQWFSSISLERAL